MNENLPQALHGSSFKEHQSPRDTKRRIETQIHRRKKARAVLPLEAEWNEDSENPAHLKMSRDHMGTGKGASAARAHLERQ
jgi:hypothetical protein